MRKIQCLLPMGLAFLVTACAGIVIGSGNVTSESRNVRNFAAVSLSGSGKLIIEQTGTESLTITAEDNILPYLTSEVRGSRLILDTRGNIIIVNRKEIIYRLTVKNFNQIEVSGSGDVVANGINVDQLKIEISGPGNVTAAGQADQLVITVSGSGDYQGENLKSKTATINVSGSGGAVVTATDILDVNVSGSGSVEYFGNPVVTERVSGSGRVRKR